MTPDHLAIPGDSEPHYRDLFESTPLPMWLSDVTSRRFLAVNDAALRAYRYSRDEFLQLAFDDLASNDDADDTPEWQTAAEGRSRIARHRRKDGSLVDVRLTIVDLNFAGRAVNLVLSEDVTGWSVGDQVVLTSTNWDDQKENCSEPRTRRQRPAPAD